MKLNEIKAGAPYRRVEIQISLRRRVARIVFIGPSSNPWMDLALVESERELRAAGSAIREAAILEGLIDETSIVAIVDCDFGPVE